MARKRKAIDFERALQELEALVERMEDGELTLEESLEIYERGIELSRRCQSALESAEQRIRILTEKTDGPVEEDFEPAADAGGTDE